MSISNFIALLKCIIINKNVDTNNKYVILDFTFKQFEIHCQ